MPFSPMMQQYLNIKENYKNAILLFRLGDFYEMFFEDAITASRELELTLTGRDCGMPERAPMCGVPFHAVDGYIAKLVAKGFDVAICEQTTAPEGGGKIVERDVVRVITPGTVVGGTYLEENRNNYIMSVFYEGNSVGIAWADVSTGEFNFDQNCTDESLVWLNEKLTAILPAEIICNKEIHKMSGEFSLVRLEVVPPFRLFETFDYKNSDFRTICSSQFKSMGDGKNEATIAAAALINYIKQQGKRDFNYISDIKEPPKYMSIDYSTRRNLELIETMREHKGKKGSVFGLLDKAVTSMGARALRNWLLTPLNDSIIINQRLDAVSELVKNSYLRASLAETLKGFFDISRLAGKLSFGTATPPDCVALGTSLSTIPIIKQHLQGVTSKKLISINHSLEDFEAFSQLLRDSFVDNPPANIANGGFIREGFNNELDELRDVSNIGKKWLMELESREKEETGIRTLKTGFNKVFGYYIEVPKSQSANVPYRYVRKQTTVNSERYITDELKVIEQKILNAEVNAIELEQKLFSTLIERLKSDAVQDILTASNSIAELDALLSLSVLAVTSNYCRPTISDSINVLEIVDGRHAVVEALSKEAFIPNDTYLDTDKNKIMVITGPNMAGKSTYMRQTALIILLAHIGSFVPARQATIPIVDRIFTRVGASDDLAFGQSTFMVEMSEVANILKNATEKSFIVFDEIGRGTSTLDGLSIAWSVIEYLSTALNTMTLFSTHYHELTELEGVLNGLKNYRVTVRELNNNIIFLHKIVRGGANKSFGIEVAKMAGVPDIVIKRAKELLKKLEKAELTHKNTKQSEAMQLSLFASHGANEIIGILKDLNIETMSPLKAFDALTNLIEKADKL